MEKGKKKIKLKKISITKESLAFGAMYLLLLSSLLAGGLTWYFFSWGYKEGAAKILAEEEVKFDKEINQEDIQAIEEFFKEREARYERSDSLIFREVF